MFVKTGLLDFQTLAEVMEHAPQPTDTPPSEARLILRALEARQKPEYLRFGADDRAYYRALLGEIQPELPETLTPKRAGMLCRAMGLTMVRVKDGFTVAWTAEQMAILKRHLEM